MVDPAKISTAPRFYTVGETAAVLRCNVSTLYRAIRDDAFPAVKIRSRYVVPATVLERLAEEAAESGGCVDVARHTAEKRAGGTLGRMTER